MLGFSSERLGVGRKDRSWRLPTELESLIMLSLLISVKVESAVRRHYDLNDFLIF